MTDSAKSDDGRGAFSPAGEGAKGLSGPEIMRRGISSEPSSRPGIGRSLNFWLVEADDGRVVFEGEPGVESQRTLARFVLTLDLRGDTRSAPLGQLAVELVPAGVDRKRRMRLEVFLDETVAERRPVLRCAARAVRSERNPGKRRPSSSATTPR